MPLSKKKSRSRRILGWGLKWFLYILLILLILTTAQVLTLRFVDPPFTARQTWDLFRNRFTNRNIKIPKYIWRPLNEISPQLKKAVLAAEDQRFISHHGFDFIEISEALRDMLNAGRVRGASTITMQVARTVFLWHGRSWWRKLAEAYYTVLIELSWPKRRILEIYLNTVDWGVGIMGAEAAADKYFKTRASSITSAQAASLASILPSPHRWSPTKPNRTLKERQKKILKDMAKMPVL